MLLLFNRASNKLSKPESQSVAGIETGRYTKRQEREGEERERDIALRPEHRLLCGVILYLAVSLSAAVRQLI